MIGLLKRDMYFILLNNDIQSKVYSRIEKILTQCMILKGLEAPPYQG